MNLLTGKQKRPAIARRPSVFDIKRDSPHQSQSSRQEQPSCPHSQALPVLKQASFPSESCKVLISSPLFILPTAIPLCAASSFTSATFICHYLLGFVCFSI